MSTWKKKLLDGSTDVFTCTNEKRDENFEQEREKLFSQIGQLKVENDFLKKISERLK